MKYFSLWIYHMLFNYSLLDAYYSISHWCWNIESSLHLNLDVHMFIMLFRLTISDRSVRERKKDWGRALVIDNIRKVLHSLSFILLYCIWGKYLVWFFRMIPTIPITQIILITELKPPRIKQWLKMVRNKKSNWQKDPRGTKKRQE